MNYKEICSEVLQFDESIRFAGIATLDGDIVASEYKKHLVPLLTLRESELSLAQSLMKSAIRRTLEGKLGRTIYATAVYEKVKRATINMYDDKARTEALLMISFEKEADHDRIVRMKILPFLHKIGKVVEGY